METTTLAAGAGASAIDFFRKIYKPVMVYTCGDVYAKMEIEDYLNHRAQGMASASQKIKDYRVFDFNYIPSRPLMRQEVKPLIDAVLRYATTGIANHLLVFGSRGSGKTLMVKYLSRLMQERHNVTFMHANCRQHNTSFKILASLLNVRPRGCSLDELWDRFCQTHAGRIVFVLDEIDLISDKDRNKDILYLISRSQRNFMAILLSNNPRFLATLDESVRSTLQPELIHFRNYDAHEIRQILADRASHGLFSTVSDQLSQLAALTTKHTNSDVRVAIKSLYYLALEPQAPIMDVFRRAQRDILLDVIADLNDRNLLILKAACLCEETQVKTVYERYRRLSQQMHEEPFSYVYFYANLSYLQSIGLIVLLSTKVGRTYTNRIQLLFDPELLETILGTRFG